MRWADVCLHPAISEGFCVSVIEAQSMGLPVVCTDADGLSENIADGVTGFVVGRRDAAALTERLMELAADPALRERMGAAATSRAHERFGFARQLDELEMLYHSALALPAPVPAGERHDTPALIETLERQLNALEVQRGALEKQLRGRRVSQGTREFVVEAVPAGATVLVVSRGDDDLVSFDGRVGWHFPQAEDGVYAGHHPQDGDAAIRHLEELRTRGAHPPRDPRDVGVVAGALRRLPLSPRRALRRDRVRRPGDLHRLRPHPCPAPRPETAGDETALALAHEGSRMSVVAPPESYTHGPLLVEGPNEQTVALVRETGARAYMEIGVYLGATASAVAEALGPDGEMHLLDFEDRVAPVAERLARAAGGPQVVAHANSRRALDSYNWSLMRLLREGRGESFDYVFVDGAHTWAHDALAFLLVDRLLKPGGHVDFDDYGWTLARSPSMNPEAFPATRQLYSDEQISEAQVALVVDLLVRSDPRYEEVVPDKVFRKRPEEPRS